MRKSIQYVALAAALGCGSAAVMADEALLEALTAAGVTLTPDQQQQVSDADASTIADVIADIVQSLGDNGAAIQSLVEAAVRAAPDQASAIASAATSVSPGAATIISSAAVRAAPAQAPAIAASVVTMAPTQAASVVSAVSAVVPDQQQAVSQAVASAVGSTQPTEENHTPVASPN